MTIQKLLECLFLSIVSIICICFLLSSVWHGLDVNDMLKFWMDQELANAIDTNCKTDACKIRASAIDRAENSHNAKWIYLWMITKKFVNADDAMKHWANVYHTKRYTNKTPTAWIVRSSYCVSENDWTRGCPNWIRNVQAWLNELWRNQIDKSIDQWLVAQDEWWSLQPIEQQDKEQHAVAKRRICRLLRRWKSKGVELQADRGDGSYMFSNSVDNKMGIAKIFKCINL